MTNTYSNYAAWKGWDPRAFMTLDTPTYRYYTKELAGIALAGRRVLEIGFGNGSFLAWARSNGAELYGTEISEEALELARAKGVTLLRSDIEAETTAFASSFDLVVAFDVLEHLSVDEIRRLLASVTQLLKPGGYFLARFPNGQSPFGLADQHGDATHITALSCKSLQQLATALPLTVIRAGDKAEVLRGNPVVRGLKQARNTARLLLEHLIRRLYYLDSPFGANVVVVFQRRESARVDSSCSRDPSLGRVGAHAGPS
jgi:SAM-dependent methyltransferase